MTKIISFLSDFGTLDGYPAACKGVIEAAFSQCKIIDISHSIKPFDIRHGAFVLAATVPYFPVSIHLAVVDPGVGSDRKIVILETERGDYMVGPDNGLLMPAAAVLGSVKRAFQLIKRFSPQGNLPKQSFENKDWKLLHSAVHKMIPSFSIMGIGVDFENMAKKVQEYASTQQQPNEILDLVLALEKVCLQACIELTEEFNRIKTSSNE